MYQLYLDLSLDFHCNHFNFKTEFKTVFTPHYLCRWIITVYKTTVGLRFDCLLKTKKKITISLLTFVYFVRASTVLFVFPRYAFTHAKTVRWIHKYNFFCLILLKRGTTSRVLFKSFNDTALDRNVITNGRTLA